MSDLWLLSEAQMRRIEPCFPLSHRIPRVDDRRIVSGIIFVIRNGLRWRDASATARARRSTTGSSAGAAWACWLPILLCYTYASLSEIEGLRAIHRPAHLDFIHANADHFVIAGPLRRADGLIIGTLLIVKAQDEAAAKAVLAGDPYLTSGVWQLIRVNEFTPLLGDWA